MPLTPELLELLRQPSPCFLSTIMADGSPQVTETWVDTDGEHVLINTVVGFLKVRNVERDPRVALAVQDPNNPFRYIQVRGACHRARDRGRRREHRGTVAEVHRAPLPLVRRA